VPRVLALCRWIDRRGTQRRCGRRRDGAALATGTERSFVERVGNSAVSVSGPPETWSVLDAAEMVGAGSKGIASTVNPDSATNSFT